jgi:hypothetical protein
VTVTSVIKRPVSKGCLQVQKLKISLNFLFSQMLARVAAADVVQGELWGRDVKLEEQVGWRVMRLRMLGNTAVCAAG